METTTNASEIRLNEAGKRIPTSKDYHVDILRYLMTYCVCPGDKDYNRRAVDSLLKKLRSHKPDLDEIIETITSRGARPSKCFTIPRTLDGRFQIAMRKGFPHVVYARIFRWEDIQKCQIIHIPSCRYGYDLQLEDICVNPYHYKKLESIEEFYNVAQSEANKGKNKPMSRKQEILLSKKLAEKKKKRIKKQNMPRKEIIDDPCQPTEESLIPIVVERQSNATEYVEPQPAIILSGSNEKSAIQPLDPKCAIRDSANAANNNIKSAIPSSSVNDQCGFSNNVYNLHQPTVENNAPIQLQNGIQQNENNSLPVDRNVETPAVSLSMCEQVLLDQSDFQGLSLNNEPRPENFQQIITLPSQTPLLVNNPQLLPNCIQQTQNFIHGEIVPVLTNKMPPPSKIPLPRNSMFSNSNQQPPEVQSSFEINQINLPPPSSVSLPNNNQQVQKVQSRFEVKQIKLASPDSTPLSNNKQRPQQVQNNFEIKQINLPPPSSTPLPSNPPMFSDSLFENCPRIERQSNSQLEKYNHKLQNKDAPLNCTLERILAENNSQMSASNNPIENTLNETLDQILSKVQNNDKKLSILDQKMQNENSLLVNNNEPIEIKNKVEQNLTSNEEVASEKSSIIVSNNKEAIGQNSQKLLPISNVSHLMHDIEALSPIGATAPLSPANPKMPLSPISSIRSMSPVNPISPVSPKSSNIQSLSSEHFKCDNSNIVLLDGVEKKIEEENDKHLININQSQSDKNSFLNEDLQDTLPENNNAPHNTSHYFSDSMISFINNNHMNQTQMSSISKCEQYLRNQSDAKNSLAYIQPSTHNSNNNNNPHIYSLQTFKNNSEQNNVQQIHYPIQSHDEGLSQNMNEFFNKPNINCRNANNLIPRVDPPLEYWCSIDYFEMDKQVGETFKVENEHSTVVVDGYLDPDGGNRFCLGRLTNVTRTAQIERTRMHIAQGIALEQNEDGDIWLRCKSKNSVFIQAHYLDMQSEYPTRHSVHKIFSGKYEKVFDLQKCYKHIKAQIATAHAALRTQLMASGPPGRPITNYSGVQALAALGMSVDDLRRFCILRISFVKGWGSDYPRQTIKETPCWIEVHVNKALQILDQFLLSDKPIVRGMD